MTTLLDIAKATGDDGIAGLIEEVVKAAPEVRLGASRTIKGIQFKTTIRTALPGGSFRSANEGSAAVKSTFENRLFDCYIANPIWTCDKAVADAHEDGSAAYIAAEAKGVTEGEIIHLGKQFYYGTSNDAKGFPGLNTMFDSTNMQVNAAGTTANTGSSVWFVKWGDDGVQWLYGNAQNPLQMSDVKEIVVNDSNSNPLTKYHQELLAWVGLKLGSLNAVAKIKNLTEDSGKGLTDSLIYDALSKFPAGRTPDVILMSRRSLKQLRASRTATNQTGAPAPIPREVEGIPIEVTDSILDTEAIA